MSTELRPFPVKPVRPANFNKPVELITNSYNLILNDYFKFTSIQCILNLNCQTTQGYLTKSLQNVKIYY